MRRLPTTPLDRRPGEALPPALSRAAPASSAAAFLSSVAFRGREPAARHAWERSATEHTPEAGCDGAASTALLLRMEAVIGR